jgi:hypothetical protein
VRGLTKKCPGIAGGLWRLIPSLALNKRAFDAMDLAHGTVNSIGKEAILRARQAEMFTQRRPFVVAPKQAAAL